MNYELILQFFLDIDNNNYKCTSEQQLQSTDSATTVVVVYFRRIQVVQYTSRHIVHTAVPYSFILFEVDSGYSSLHSWIAQYVYHLSFILYLYGILYSGLLLKF